MKRVAVRSSNVAEVGYDPNTRTLEVAFIRGGVYHHLNVPSSVHQALLVAPSVGKYLDVNVKKAGYAARKIAD